MLMNRTYSARALALKLLCDTERSKQFSNIALDKALSASDLSDADRRLVSRLYYGVLEKKLTLDYQLSHLCSRPLDGVDSEVREILRLGLYQLMFADKIPPHAAINETVSLCSRRTSGFVNAVLRSFLRNGEAELPSKESEPEKYLSVAYSVCEALCKRLVSVYGAERTESILASLDARGTTVRVNTLKQSREALNAKIEGAVPTRYARNGLSVSGAVRELYGFESGAFFVQDEASQICVEALDAREGMTVMDICACPGSKSFGAAIEMNGRGRVMCFDLHENKLSLILSGAERLGIDIISVQRQDGRAPIEELFESADRVLCDVPCSGFGVLAKKPELRYKDPQDSAALPDIQLAILENACRYVKRGGVLVYSTCTILPEENEKNIERFLSTHQEFSLCPFSVGELSAENGYITLLPDTHGTDGFFISKLIRT